MRGRFIRVAIYAAVVIGILGVPTAGAVVFASAGNPAENGQDTSFAIADFNGDGHLDYAVACTGWCFLQSDGNRVGILLGDGTGQFTVAPGSPISVSPGLNYVATADVNGDGHPDLVVAENGNDDVLVLLGNGNGSFTPASSSPLALPASPTAIATADVNGDGKPDLAVQLSGGTFEILPGDGHGGFTAGASYGVAGGQPSGQGKLIAADFNGDGHLDLVNWWDGDFSVWLGDGNGHFTETSASPYQLGIPSVGDFNNDGRPDLVGYVGSNNALTVMLNDGSGGFAPASETPVTTNATWPAYEGSIPVADFNGDGNLDVVSDNSGTNLVLLLGDGQGGFKPADNSPFAGIWPIPFVAAADFNGDGYPDLIGSRASVLLNEPPSTSIASGPATTTRSTSAAFTFTSNDAPVTYQCRLDGATWAACSAHQGYSSLNPGSHTLAVRAVSSNGRVDPSPATQTWTIDDSSPAVAALTVTPSRVLIGQSVTLDASQSYDPLAGGSIVDYQWDLGDGNFSQDTGSTPTLTHSFSATGTYAVRVKVTNNVGDSATADDTVYVCPTPPPGNVGVSIDNGDYATNSPDVQLDVVWPEYAAQALISNDGGFGSAGGTKTVPLAATIPWTLRSQANEKLTKIAYVRFPDSANPLLTFSDDIVVDTTTPVVQSATSATTSSPSKTARRTAAVDGKTFKVRIHAREQRSGISQAQFSSVKHGGTIVRLRGRTVRGFTTLSRVVGVTMKAAPRFVRVRSAAGNWSKWHRIG